ncbi:MAG TPA: ThuA domain-containing protein [Bryobacteraceae bacterium]|jgi:type 1 glutamine amidotransferase|nr:ThuA domain-containing protein [Bryobacteraceae bacterium]
MRTVFAAAFLVGSTCFGQGAGAPQPVRVLIIDGINNHDWLAATNAVRGFLTKTGRFLVDVSTTPPGDAPETEWDMWRPDFSGYKAVIVNFNSGEKANSKRWPHRVEVQFEQYVRNGGGVVFLHAANNAFLNWKAYNEMIGLGWRDKNFGPGLRVTADGKVVEVPKGTGFNPGHGPRHDFQVHVLDRDHPITRGMPPVWMHPSEQLTHGQHGPAEGLTVLTYANSDVTHENEPMDWVRNYGKGRIYVTMLGHTWKGEANPDVFCAGFQTLFSRGVEWAATGRVTIPIPADFPGPDKVAVRPPTEH